MATTFLSKTFSTTGNRQKFTLSMWFKRGIVPVGNQSGTEGMIFQAYQDSGNQDQIWLQSNGTINYVRNNANAVTPSQMLRDPSAWYHLVFAGDTTQGSNADRLKVYVNGIQAPIGQQDTITQNSNFGAINNAQQYTFGKRNSNDWYFDGSMSHIHLIDGTAYPASTFGFTDTTTGEWTINPSPNVTYGTNGFFILKDNGAKTDQSGNGNNFSEEGTPGIVSNTQDSPSNVFATLNPLDNKFATDAVFSNGNTYVAAGGAGNGRFYSTLGMVSGKYYCEIKNVSGSGGTPLFAVTGTSNYALSSAGSPLSSQLYDYALYNGNVYNNDATVGGTWGTPSDGNIIGIAINLDNEQGGLNKLYFSINGVWQNGADPSNLTSTTGVVGIIKPENMTGNGVGAYFFACGDDNSFAERRFATNFGNGYFQTTAVSSAGTNASGNGIFEYDVPTGYTALSTKGLNL